MKLSKSKKEKLIQTDGNFSNNKVKSYMEKEDLKNKNMVSRGKDITFNKLWFGCFKPLKRNYNTLKRYINLYDYNVTLK